MAKSKTSVELQTAFASYRIIELIGQGGSGRVYEAIDNSENLFAIKILTDDSLEKRKRFKNEISFLVSNKHKNIVSVLDHGFATSSKLNGPFYVMKRYDGSLRKSIKAKIAPNEIMGILYQIFDGVEAAHLLGVIHRDLKPENILISAKDNNISIADFGIAHFTDDMVHTSVETAPGTRLANFSYAAPEQKAAGRSVTFSSDIWALGLIINEMFTNEVPNGTGYKTISQTYPEYEFLDDVVSLMLRQDPLERPSSIGQIKNIIQKFHSDTVSRQKLNVLNNTVIPAGEIDDPLALEPPVLTGVYYDNGVLKLTLDRPVNDNWIQAFRNMGNYTSVAGLGPRMFEISGKIAAVRVDEQSAQDAIEYFKKWLPVASNTLKFTLSEKIRKEEILQRDNLRRAKEAEEKRVAINRRLHI